MNNTLTTTPPCEQDRTVFRWTSAATGNDLVLNNVSNNAWNGLAVTGSDWNNLTSNKANDNTLSGINLTDSNRNTLFNNTANSNSQNGIALTNSSNNTLYQNTARYNHQDGILVNLSSNGNNLTENQVCGNLWNGIEVNGIELERPGQQ